MNNNNNNNNSRQNGSGKQKQKQQRKQKQPKQRAPRKQKQAAAAAAYATGQVGKAPVIKMSRDTCRIVHRELIASVVGTTAFTVAQTFALNPGLAASFPWLSVMAQGWEQYRFRKLKFCYYTRTGSNVPGSVLLAPDYDAADAPPASEQIASAFEDVAEDAPWKDIECLLTQLSMAGGTTRHFTRNGALAANLDIKTYDVGNLHLCTIDGTAVPWGKLWVEYDIEFFVPQLPPTGLPSLTGGEWEGSDSANSAANPFGTAPNSTAGTAGVSINGASVMTFATAGTYLVSVVYDGTVITAAALPTASAGVSVNTNQVVINAAGTQASQVVDLVTTLPNSTLAFSITATTVDGAAAFIAQAPAGSLL
jgi:hypothetical protein